MMPILLNSNGLYHTSGVALFNEIIHTQKIEKKACIITTADKDYKEKNYHAVRTKSLLESLGVQVDYLDVEFEDANRITEYKVIYLNGGNPFYLLYHLRSSKADEIIYKLRDRGHLIVGQSAGAAVLGQSLEHAYVLHPDWNEIQLEDLTGIGIVSGCVLPHSNRYREQEDILKKYDDKPYKLIRIEDGNCLVL
ncbi:Type 1 glutamine amidotransferase-like domain-containing protein [Paenibacillus sp. FSL R7-0204]|uniref:Type 1 glutamine amidotransferase-like domain-containing protein n=1 Tax=Paenibacillus sp. FSL R7-0204 TaxID=2921675 RepID=UPI0030F8CD46